MNALVYGRGDAPAGSDPPRRALRQYVPALRLPGAWELLVPVEAALACASRANAWGWEPERELAATDLRSRLDHRMRPPPASGGRGIGVWPPG